MRLTAVNEIEQIELEISNNNKLARRVVMALAVAMALVAALGFVDL